MELLQNSNDLVSDEVISDGFFMEVSESELNDVVGGNCGSGGSYCPFIWPSSFGMRY